MVSDAELESSSPWPPRFTDNISIVSLFLFTFVLITFLSNLAQSWVLGEDPTRITTVLSQIPVFVLTGAIVLVALRAEDVHLRDLGVSWKQARIASVVVGGIVVTVNVVVLGLAVLSGTELSLGVYPQYTRRLDATTTLLILGAVNNYLFVGPVEELVFRGYIQNKVLDLIDGPKSWLRTGLGIVTTAALFAVVHLPNLLLDEGVVLSRALGGLVLLMATATLFGFVYELTENLVLVAMLHGLGNWWLLVVDPGPGVWPNYAVLLGLYAVTIVLYRRSRYTNVSTRRNTQAASHIN